MRILVKKVLVVILTIFMANLTSMQANAQAGTIAGVSTDTAVIIGGILIAGVIVAEAIDDDDPLPATVISTTTTTTTN